MFEIPSDIRGISFGAIKSGRDTAWRGEHLLGLLLLSPEGQKGQISLRRDLPPNRCTLWSCVESLLSTREKPGSLPPVRVTNGKIELLFKKLHLFIYLIFSFNANYVQESKTGDVAAGAGTDAYRGGHMSAMWNNLSGWFWRVLASACMCVERCKERMCKYV